MICDFCKSNEASIHLIKVTNNNVEKINLCMDCVKNYSFFSTEDFFSDLTKILSKFFEIDIKIRRISRQKHMRQRHPHNCVIDYIIFNFDIVIFQNQNIGITAGFGSEIIEFIIAGVHGFLIEITPRLKSVII